MSPKWMHLVGLTDICVVKELSVVWSGSEAVAAIGDRHFGRSRGRCLLAFQSLAGRRSNRCMLQSVRRKASWTCLFSFRHVREQFRGARKSLVFARARAQTLLPVIRQQCTSYLILARRYRRRQPCLVPPWLVRQCGLSVRLCVRGLMMFRSE